MRYFGKELDEIVDMLNNAESDNDIIRAYEKYKSYMEIDGFVEAVGEEPPIIALVDIYHSIAGE